MLYTDSAFNEIIIVSIGFKIGELSPEEKLLEKVRYRRTRLEIIYWCMGADMKC